MAHAQVSVKIGKRRVAAAVRDFPAGCGRVAAKACNKAVDHDSSDDGFICKLSKNRNVSVRTWQGKVLVDIREYFEKDGQQLPGKKGISMSVDQWNILLEHIDEVDQALDQ